MAERIVKRSKRTALAGDPFGAVFGGFELFKSKKGSVLGVAYGAFVPLITSEKLPAVHGSIILGAITVAWMVMQGLVDKEKEKNRVYAGEVITTELRAPDLREPVQPLSTVATPELG